MVDKGGLFFLAPIVLAIPFAVRDALKRTGKERTIATIAAGAAVALACVLAAKDLGWVNDGPFFQTVRFSLSLLFVALYFQIMRFGKRTG